MFGHPVAPENPLKYRLSVSLSLRQDAGGYLNVNQEFETAGLTVNQLAFLLSRIGQIIDSGKVEA